jgi:hypothetical protein
MSAIDILYYAYWIWMPLSLFFFCIRRILWRIQWSSHRLRLAHLSENLFIGSKFSYMDWGWWLLLIAIEILVFQWLCCIFKKITCFINLYWCLWRFGGVSYQNLEIVFLIWLTLQDFWHWLTRMMTYVPLRYFLIFPVPYTYRIYLGVLKLSVQYLLLWY